jgi:hypothetical protein
MGRALPHASLNSAFSPMRSPESLGVVLRHFSTNRRLVARRPTHYGQAIPSAQKRAFPAQHLADAPTTSRQAGCIHLYHKAEHLAPPACTLPQGGIPRSGAARPPWDLLCGEKAGGSPGLTDDPARGQLRSMLFTYKAIWWGRRSVCVVCRVLDATDHARRWSVSSAGFRTRQTTQGDGLSYRVNSIAATRGGLAPTGPPRPHAPLPGVGRSRR